MKATKIFLASVFALLFFVGWELSAQSIPHVICDSNETKVTVVVTLPDPFGYDVEITYCCREFATHPMPRVTIKRIRVLQPQAALGTDFAGMTFWEAVEQALIGYLDDNPSAPCGFQSKIPSCDSQYDHKMLEMWRSDCWKLQNYSDPMFPSIHYLDLNPCTEPFECQRVYSICYDYAQDKYVKTVHSWSYYEGDCEEGSLFIPNDVPFSETGMIMVPFESQCKATCH